MKTTVNALQKDFLLITKKAIIEEHKTFSLFKNAKADKHPNFFAAIDFFDEELTSFLDKMKKENIPQLKMAIRLIEKIFNDR